MHGQDQHRLIGLDALDLRECLNSVHVGHRNVQQNDIPVRFAHHFYSVGAGSGLAGHGKFMIFGEELFKARSYDFMVVHY